MSSTSEPYEITAGPDGNIWFTLPSAGKIGMVQVNSNPTTDTIALTSVPTTVETTPQPVGIATGPDGNIWFTDSSGAIGQAALATQVAIAAQPPASVTAGDPFTVTAKVVYSDTGVVKSSFSGTMTATLNGLGTLSGNSATITNGVASFTALTASTAGTGNTLTLATGTCRSRPAASL